MIRSLIIDDEIPNIELIKLLVEKYCPDIEIIDESDNIPQGIEKIIKLKPDLIFLDIEVHQQNAFDLLTTLNDDTLNIILVSGFDHYGLQAIQHSIIAYILKPISIADLIAAVAKAKRVIEDKKKLQRLKTTTEHPTMFALPSKEDFEVTPFTNIIRLEAKGSYTTIYTNDQRTHLLSKRMKDVEIHLPKDLFLRVHHSHIINLGYVYKLVKARSANIILKDHTTIPISANYKAEVAERIVF